jgi:hypothetical protein
VGGKENVRHVRGIVGEGGQEEYTNNKMASPFHVRVRAYDIEFRRISDTRRKVVMQLIIG